VLQDVRYALRSLWHSRGFAIVAVLCLGFGIGVNTTIFSIVDGVLLKPFPYKDPDRILQLSVQNPTIGATGGNISYPDLQDWRESAKTFETIGAVQGRSLTISDGGEPARYLGAMVTWDLFPMLGVSPEIGHYFTPDQDKPSGGGAVILSYAVWRDRYQKDRNILGRQILVNAAPAEIIGVMPEGFEFPSNQKLWIPVTPTVAKDGRGARTLFTFGRLKPGVTIEQAQTELSAIAGRLATAYPDTNKDWDAEIRTLRDVFIPPNVTLVIWLMMVAVTLVLVIAFSNVANLLLARASARRREITVRSALGAGRGRIIRQLLTESVVIAIVSLPLGIMLAEIGTRLISGAMPPDQVPAYITWTVDWRTLAYTASVAVTTAILFGLFPALQASRGNLHETLKEGTRGNTVRRSLLRSGLVATQVALALVALVIALMFVRTFGNLDGHASGFDSGSLMTMRFYLPGAPYDPVDAKLQRVQDIVKRVEALPGVQSAFASNFVPLSGGGGGGPVVIEGQPAPSGRQQPGITFVGVTPHMYSTLGISVKHGRDFTEAEGYSRAPVAIISEAMAKRFWPDREPVGGRFHMSSDGPEGPWYTVIGVATDFQMYGLNPGNDQPTQVAFAPYAYQQSLNTGLTVRVAGAPAAITRAVREQIRQSDPNLPMFQAQTMSKNKELSYWQYGLYGWIFGTIGVVGLLLASVGVYGVLAYAVTQRTQEIGVRVALGAGSRQVIILVVRYGLVLCGIGIAAGLVLAPLASWQARTLFFHVSPFDPVTFAAVSALLVVVAFLASALPALRATKVNPIIALRGE